MMFCLPVKNGWQLLQTSTRSESRVEPTSNSMPHEPQWTFAWWYLGWMSGFTECSFDAVRRVVPAGGRRAGSGSYASEATGSAATGMIRTRFLSRVSCSKRTFPSTVAKIV